jgi:Methionine biosynthesis protein MetW.
MNKNKSIRKDWKLIESFIENNSKVLDIGCGEGELIKQLENNIQADTRGIEIDPNWQEMLYQLV